MATNDVHRYSKWKSLLRDIYDSEDLKIKGERSKRIRNTIHRLCSETIEKEDLESFVVSFNKVQSNVQGIKDACKQTEQDLFQRLFQYQANCLSLVTQCLPTDLKDPILWQVSKSPLTCYLAAHHIHYFHWWHSPPKSRPCNFTLMEKPSYANNLSRLNCIINLSYVL